MLNLLYDKSCLSVVVIGSNPGFAPDGLRAKRDIFCMLQIFVEYFKALEEESIKDNFVLVYELLDEVMDFGLPQTTDSKILQE